MEYSSTYPLSGGCSCGNIRYQVESHPLVVHCCHCSWCQRESGASFALNAMIETDRITLTSKQAPERVDTPSASGKGQRVMRCPNCRVAVWSHYDGGGRTLSFVRVGTLDEPRHLPPDIHIFTSTKQPWVVLPKDTPAVPEYYSAREIWGEESLSRMNALKALSPKPPR